MFNVTKESWEELYLSYVGEVTLRPVNPEGPTVKHVDSGCTTDSYGVTDGECWVLFEYEGKRYKKYGYRDSYDGNTWDGRVVEVVKQIKTIEVWEEV